MKFTEIIKKIINRNNPEFIADRIADSYQERKENGEKDPVDHTVEDIIKVLKENPDRKRAILAYILENDNLPDRLFEKAATEISKDKDIPDSVIADVVQREDTSISDESINNIIKEGKVNPNERIKLISNIEDKEILEKQVENELKILYKTCKDKRDGEVKDRIEEIEELLNPEEIDGKIKNDIQLVIARKMAENYYSDLSKGTNIYTLSQVMPVEDMIERNLPSTVEREYKKIESERIPKAGRFNKKEFEKLILEELGKKVGIKYEETGVYIIPQSENLKKIDEEEKNRLIRAIQIYSGKQLTKEEIIDIDEQIRGTSNNIQIKENTIINLIKKLPKENKKEKIDILAEILQNEGRFETIKELKESGFLEKIEKIPEEKRQKIIGAIGDTINKREEHKANKNTQQQGQNNSDESVIDIYNR